MNLRLVHEGQVRIVFLSTVDIGNSDSKFGLNTVSEDVPGSVQDEP